MTLSNDEKIFWTFLPFLEDPLVKQQYTKPLHYSFIKNITLKKKILYQTYYPSCRGIPKYSTFLFDNNELKQFAAQHRFDIFLLLLFYYSMQWMQCYFFTVQYVIIIIWFSLDYQQFTACLYA